MHRTSTPLQDTAEQKCQPFANGHLPGISQLHPRGWVAVVNKTQFIDPVVSFADVRGTCTREASESVSTSDGNKGMTRTA
jgi:hypothetical protein